MGIATGTQRRKASTWCAFTVAATSLLVITATGASVDSTRSAPPPLQRGAARKQVEEASIDINRVIQAGRRRNSGEGQSLLGDQFTAAVAFDGTRYPFDGANYLVVWQDSRDSPSRIYGARVSPAGSVFDQGGVAISQGSGEHRAPVIAFDRTNFLVVWEANGDIQGTRVTRAGHVLGPTISISTAPNAQGLPAIEFDGTNYLVTWQDERSGGPVIFGARVTPSGNVLDPGGIPISGSVGGLGPALAFDGTNYLVAWYGAASNNSYIYGARVSRGGAVLDPGGIPISVGSQIRRLPSIAFDATNYLVAWEYDFGQADIYAARVTTAGTVLDANDVMISDAPGDQRRPKVAFTGFDHLVTWDDARSGNADIYGARVTPGGAVLDPAGRQITAEQSQQSRPAVTSAWANNLVVWEDSRLGNRKIYGARVSPTGIVLDPSGILISTEPAQPPPPADTQRPRVHALKSRGRRGGVARLRYTVYDNSGIARVRILVSRRGRVVTSTWKAYSPARRGRVYVVRLRAVRNAPHRLRFCVFAEDRARNRSRTSCAALLLK